MKIISLTAVFFLSTAFSFATDSTNIVSDETVTVDSSSLHVQSDSKDATDSVTTGAEERQTADSSESSTFNEISTVSEKDHSAIAADSSNKTPSDSTMEASKNSATIIDESEEELILDGGEESIIIPTVVEKPVVDSALPDSDSTKPENAASTDSSGSPTKSAEIQKPRIPISPIPEKVSATAEPAPKLKIEQMKSINFAKNQKNYRSPKIAILLSLLFPGAGQAYAKNYLKSGIFGAVEVALITAGAIMGVKGSEQLDEAHEYADKHYSVDKFQSYYTNMSDNLISDDLAEIFLTEGEVDTFYSDAKNKNQSYYNFVGFTISPYLHGWDDATPEFNLEFEPINNGNDTTYFTDPQYKYLVNYTVSGDTNTYEMNYGRSKNQETYNKKVSEANDSYRWSKNFFTILIINHVASAIDAAITAKAYNDQLLGKTSFLNNINIREKLVSTPSEPANGLALEVRF